VIPRKPMRFDYGYHFLDTLKLTSVGEDFIIAALSEAAEVDALYLGKIAEFNGLMGKNLLLDSKGAHVIYVIGKRRSGKSYTLGVIAEGLVDDDLHMSETGKKQAVLIFDTLNLYWTMENTPSADRDGEQLKELGKWGLSPKPFKNLMCYYPRGFRQSFTPAHYQEFGIRPSDLEGTDWANLFEVDPIIDPMGQLLCELFEKVAIEGYIGSRGVKLKPNPNYAIRDLLACLEDDKDVERFPLGVREAVRRRLKAVERFSIFSETGTDVRDLFKAERITVLLLRDLDHQVRGLVIGLLVKKIMKLRGITNECEKRLEMNPNEEDATKLKDAIEKGLPRGWILIDEAHNYIPQTGIIGSKASLKKYVNEGRNIGLSIAVTTQQPSGLDAAIRRNADILVIHSITMKGDLEVTEGMLNTEVPDVVDIAHVRFTSRVFEHMVRELQVGYAIISCPNANRIFLSKMRPRVTAHGGREY
jgi:DNA helicase HerA-like ATPase